METLEEILATIGSHPEPGGSDYDWHVFRWMEEVTRRIAQLTAALEKIGSLERHVPEKGRMA